MCELLPAADLIRDRRSRPQQSNQLVPRGIDEDLIGGREGIDQGLVVVGCRGRWRDYNAAGRHRSSVGRAELS